MFDIEFSRVYRLCMAIIFFFISIPKHSRENHEMSVKHLVWYTIGSLILKTRIGTFRIKTVLEEFRSVTPSYLPFLFFSFALQMAL